MLDPLARSGVLQISPSEDDALSREVSVGINQVQLEQDTAKSFSATGDGQFTVDVNRAGVGLVEIVTEPDMRWERQWNSSDISDHPKRLLPLLESSKAS
jgi:aspartyl-tRNA(Asn)/glutamyl-tRNA(Gln) amidotransferase subunit B